MKFTNLRAFDKHLLDAAPAHFAPIYMLYDKDSYTLRALTRAIQKALSLSHDSDRVFYGSDIEEKNLFMHLQTKSLFVDKTSIVIHQMHLMKKNLLSVIENYIKQPYPDIILIFSAAKKGFNTALEKLIEKNGIIVDLLEEKPWDREDRLTHWMQQKLSKRGIRISFALAKKCVVLCASDQGRIAEEIEKLTCYLGLRKEVIESDITRLTNKAVDENIWHLGQHILRKEIQKALAMHSDLIAANTPSPVLVHTLRLQFQELLQLFSQEAKPNIEKKIALAKSYGYENLTKALLLLADYDLRNKSESSNTALLSELLIIRLCQEAI